MGGASGQRCVDVQCLQHGCSCVWSAVAGAPLCLGDVVQFFGRGVEYKRLARALCWGPPPSYGPRGCIVAAQLLLHSSCCCIVLSASF
jgi:hypothetical protein